MYDDISVKLQIRPGHRPVRVYWSAVDIVMVVCILGIFFGIGKYWNYRIREIDAVEQFTADEATARVRILTLDKDLGEINDFIEGDSFMTYLQAIPKSQYSLKLDSSCTDIPSFKRTFRSLIMTSSQISKEDYKYLVEAVLVANKKVAEFTGRYDLVNFDDVFQRTPWNIIVMDDTSTRFEKGMPCTLDRYIILPYRFICRQKQENQEQSRLPFTLIHEKIHIIQRHNQSDFDTYYRRIWGRFMSRREFPWKYREQYFVNPDGLDINWTYGTFFPFLESTPNGVKEWYMDVSAPRESAWKTRNDLLDVVMTIPDADKLHGGMSIYHPNEFFAYAVIENITTATSRLLFLSDLESIFSIIRYKAT